MDPNLFDFETKVNFSLPTLFIGSQFATTPECNSLFVSWEEKTYK